MIPSNKKIERMIQASRLYYEQDMTQSLIAQNMGISRPLVSQLITEAKACGIVTIRINEVENREALLRHRLLQQFGLRSAVVVPDAVSAEATDRAVAAAAYQLCFQEGAGYQNVGVGWGSIMGLMADYVDTLTPRPHRAGIIFPLIGGISASYRGYHTNEIIRIFSVKSGLDGEYLYSPAIFSTEEELQLTKSIASSQRILQQWDHIDLALLNLSDFPAYPDLEEGDRFGDLLASQPAAGRFLAHYYSSQGTILQPRKDTVFQASLEQLRRAKQVTAVCSAQLRPQCVLGALGLGLIHTLVLPVSLAQQLLDP